ncbi:hypothetical protein LEP1GSC170_2630 [Leptospira interrogans serovar Bataviae str. HAI135]|nr:hypothetical protein LEP1GSC170_2630 [Leptospira interrogans serovar Bataviae str. HAI135]
MGNVSFILQDAAKLKEAEKGLKRGKIVSRYINGVRHIAHLRQIIYPEELFPDRKKSQKTTDLKLQFLTNLS